MRTYFGVMALVCTFSAAAGELTEAAVKEAATKAADFLVKSQNDDGTFGKVNGSTMPGVVGLVVEALAKPPEKRPADAAVIAKAVKYILSKQQPSGAFAIKEFGLENYNTSVACIGLAALEDPALKAPLEKARDFILTCQIDMGKEFPTHGSFTYGSVKKGDLSNTAFSLEALKALRLEEGSPAWENAIVFIKRCQDNAETNDSPKMKDGNNSGGFVYVPGESPFGTESSQGGKKYVARPYGNMTYEAVKSLIYAGMKKNDPAMAAAFKWIKNNYSVKEHPGAVGNEGYYYYIIALAKAFTVAGVKEVDLPDGRKAEWARDLATQLISIQKPDGSFVNTDARWMENNPVLTTSYALQALSLCAKALKKEEPKPAPVAPKEPAKEAPKEPAKDAPKEPAKEAPKDAAKEPPKEPAKDAPIDNRRVRESK